MTGVGRAVPPPRGTLADRLNASPWPARRDLAEKRLLEWVDSLGPRSSLRVVLSKEPISALLCGIADHSPFLWRLTTADPERCARLFDRAPEDSLDRCLDDLVLRLREPAADVVSIMRALRVARQEVALLVALADLGGVWSVEEVTQSLTRFADLAVQCAVEFLVREAQRSGKLNATATAATCGLVVLALGKQGAGELNYSSDIDLIVLFDPRAEALPEATVAPPFYVRLTQSLARLLQERMADGYVLRVDLRLRPDPASTAVAIALPSAFSYYETLGQNWERAAFIKARPVAGDLALGHRFLADLAPFIWRKYFDYAAIADIHAMKRQIHAVRGHAEVAIAGHNIKLGRGGIREIEFFVQTQQLIFGGRRPALRGARTLEMLAALESDGWIDNAAVADLTAAYRFLRQVEHRLQMVDDQQTQRLPSDDEALASFARFAGFVDLASFSEALLTHLYRVEAHYARLFEHAPGLDTEAGSLVFTGTASDPETIETLRVMGFTRPEDVSEMIRGWHFGRRSAVQSARAREVLTELVPALLAAFSRSGNPDAALATFDTMLGHMSSAVELLSLLRSNAALRDLFADILGSAPRLAATIAQRPHVLDAAIDPALLGGGERAAHVEGVLARSRSTEDFLDRMRDLAQEELFLIGVRTLSGVEEPSDAGNAYAKLADLLIKAALERSLQEFFADHGHLRDGACVVLGMGKLGSRELTATSDLDLIVIYRFAGEGGESDGPKPLDGSRYYTRVTQRLIAALTVPTRRGRLYDVDVRLRPSGRQGPLAVQLPAFVHYQREEAQVWEHMALTRARIIAGDAKLGLDVEEAIRDTLLTPRDPAVLRREIKAMRMLIAKEKGDSGFWDMKLAPGGLLDIEFIAQILVLRFAAEQPSICERHPAAVIRCARNLGILDEAAASVLLEAHELQTALAQLTRLTIEGTFDPEKAGDGVLRRLCAAANQPDLSVLKSSLSELRAEVRQVFSALLEA